MTSVQDLAVSALERMLEHTLECMEGPYLQDETQAEWRFAEKLHNIREIVIIAAITITLFSTTLRDRAWTNEETDWDTPNETYNSLEKATAFLQTSVAECVGVISGIKDDELGILLDIPWIFDLSISGGACTVAVYSLRVSEMLAFYAGQIDLISYGFSWEYEEKQMELIEEEEELGNET